MSVTDLVRNTGDGIQAARKQMPTERPAHRQEATDIILLVTDGVPNDAEHTQAQVRRTHSHSMIMYPLTLNPLTAGAAYLRVFIFYWRIKYHLINMLKIKCDINQQY